METRSPFCPPLAVHMRSTLACTTQSSFAVCADRLSLSRTRCRPFFGDPRWSGCRRAWPSSTRNISQESSRWSDFRSRPCTKFPASDFFPCEIGQAFPQLHSANHGRCSTGCVPKRSATREPRKVDIRLPGKGNSNTHGASSVHQTISMIKWIRTRRLSMKNSL